jgi:uncharacterized membrane protein
MIVFIGFSFEFFIRGDQFLGGVMIFSGLLNLVAFQQAPRRIATVTLLLNFFNTMLAAVVAYNYLNQNYLILTIVWLAIFLGYLIATLRQLFGLITYKRYKKKLKKRMS